MYHLPDGNNIRKGDKETQAFCTSEYSDLAPLNDGSVPFALLEGRPSAPEFDTRPEFWVNIITFLLDVMFFQCFP